MASNHPDEPRRNDMRQVEKLRSNKLGQAGAALGIVLAVWLAAGAPAYWY